MRDHWPFQLGYLLESLASSAACAPLIVTISATASTNAELRSNMIVLPRFGSFIDREGRDIHASVPPPTLVSLWRTHLYKRRKQRDTRIRIHRLRGTPQSPSCTTSSSEAPAWLCRASCLLDWNTGFCSCLASEATA